MESTLNPSTHMSIFLLMLVASIVNKYLLREVVCSDAVWAYRLISDTTGDTMVESKLCRNNHVIDKLNIMVMLVWRVTDYLRCCGRVGIDSFSAYFIMTMKRVAPLSQQQFSTFLALELDVLHYLPLFGCL